MLTESAVPSMTTAGVAATLAGSVPMRMNGSVTATLDPMATPVTSNRSHHELQMNVLELSPKQEEGDESALVVEEERVATLSPRIHHLSLQTPMPMSVPRTPRFSSATEEPIVMTSRPSSPRGSPFAHVDWTSDQEQEQHQEHQEQEQEQHRLDSYLLPPRSTLLLDHLSPPPSIRSLILLDTPMTNTAYANKSLFHQQEYWITLLAEILWDVIQQALGNTIGDVVGGWKNQNHNNYVARPNPLALMVNIWKRTCDNLSLGNQRNHHHNHNQQQQPQQRRLTAWMRKQHSRHNHQHKSTEAATTWTRSSNATTNPSSAPATSTPTTNTTTIQGVPNYGQTCFLNVILQALASLPSFVVYLEWVVQRQQHQHQHQQYDDDQQYHSSKMNQQRNQTTGTAAAITISELLLPLLRAVNGQSQPQTHGKHTSVHPTIDPRHLLWRIAQKHNQFHGSHHHHPLIMSTRSSTRQQQQQQDAQEFLQALMDVIVVDAHLQTKQQTTTAKTTHTTSSSTSSSQDGTDAVQLIDFGFWQPSWWLLQEQHQDYDKSPLQSAQHDPHGDNDHEEKKDEDDEVLTVLSDRWVSRGTGGAGSSHGSACSSDNDEDKADGLSSLDSSPSLLSLEQHQLPLQGQPSTNGGGLLNIKMIDSTGQVSAYQKDKTRQQQQPPATRANAPSVTPTTKPTPSPIAPNPVEESPVTSSTTESNPVLTNSNHHHLSASMRIMRSTISSITPTPLCGWVGSALQCQTCHHVRPINNAPFFDLPMVPTSVAAMSAYSRQQQQFPCTIQQCLENFVQVEAVSDVICANCTIQAKIGQWQDEVDLLQGAVVSLDNREQKQKQQQKTMATVTGEATALHKELETAKVRLHHWQRRDPDTYEPVDADSEDVNYNTDMEKEETITMLRSKAYKCLLLTRLPSVLCLHVQRRYYDPATNRMSKTLQHVAFERVLDLAPYCAYGGGSRRSAFAGQSNIVDATASHKLTPMLYRLTCVVEHRGDAFGGHYVCYRRIPPKLDGGDEDQWYFCSDETIRRTSWQQVRTCQAYMLFYEAI